MFVCVCVGGGGASNSTGRHLHQPIALNIVDMLDAFEVNGHSMGTCVGGGGSGGGGGEVGFKLYREAPTPAHSCQYHRHAECL